MTEKKKALVFLSMQEIPLKRQELLLERMDDFSIAQILKNVDQILSQEEVIRLQENYDKNSLDSAIENMEKSGIQLVSIFDETYPKSLANLPERPLLLYAKGDLSILDEKCLAIVGTRMPTSYGKMVTEKFAKKLAESGLVIVSGLCYGVDQIAHRATLDVGGKTVAVVASGFNKLYPSTNTDLAKEIVESGGLVLSEYPPSFMAKKYTFPFRNRIVAGLSAGVLIAEAGFKSGTVHTKEYACEYGKDLFAIPGSVYSGKSELTNHLIRTAQAECVTCPEDILDVYGLQAKKNAKKIVTLSFDEQKIIELLSQEERDFDFLAKNLDIPVNILNSCLTTLEIRGLIRKLPAQTYALA